VAQQQQRRGRRRQQEPLGVDEAEDERAGKARHQGGGPATGGVVIEVTGQQRHRHGAGPARHQADDGRRNGGVTGQGTVGKGDQAREQREEPNGGGHIATLGIGGEVTHLGNAGYQRPSPSSTT
jgi:hypothetical protein